jgi:hypothetical protein
MPRRALLAGLLLGALVALRGAPATGPVIELPPDLGEEEEEDQPPGPETPVPEPGPREPEPAPEDEEEEPTTEPA